MSDEDNKELKDIANKDYAYGFETKIEQNTLEAGLDKDVIREISNFSILKLTFKDGEFISKSVKLSENFSIFNFGGSSSNLPTVYSKKEGPFKKILAMFGIV